MILSLTACGNPASQTEPSSTEKNFAESAANDTAPAENSSAGNVESTDVLKTQTEETEMQEEQETKILVAYFSATDTTEGVAEHIANGLKADLYEIVPEEPYTDADLNYNDNNSRTTIEMNDPDARLAISGSVENMEQYDIVFVIQTGGTMRRWLSFPFWRKTTLREKGLCYSAPTEQAGWHPAGRIFLLY